MNQKITVAILCGGQSTEHEVSVNSARNILKALDAQRYDVKVILISKQGEWYLFDAVTTFLAAADPGALLGTGCTQRVTLPTGGAHAFITLTTKRESVPVDVIFPVLHGAHGEDGTLQGLLELTGIAYVGAGVLSSAVCMDKEVSKILLRAKNINTANWLMAEREQIAMLDLHLVVAKLGLPLFVKPANTGSSVGISKVKTLADLPAAIDLALQFDHKIIFEEFIAGREIECSVLGNEQPVASVPGEIVIRQHEFYTYDAKYLDLTNIELVIPARLPESLIAKIQVAAVQAYRALGCEGLARVDFFVTPDETVFVNEINTLPGFTLTSMYPKMWENSGLAYGALLDRLIALALQRFERNKLLAAKKKLINSVAA